MDDLYLEAEHGISCICKRVLRHLHLNGDVELVAQTFCGRDDRGTLSLRHYREHPEHVDSLRERGQLCQQCEVLANA